MAKTPKKRKSSKRATSLNSGASGKKLALKNASLSVEPSAFVLTAMKRVDFSCSCPDCVVGITAAHLDLAFIGTGGDKFPVGSYNLFYRVQGVGPFTVTVSGATLSAPISGTAPDAGVRIITV